MMTTTKIANWEFNESRLTYTREVLAGRLMVGRFDGWNWGWMFVDQSGELVAGQINSNMDVYDAISKADAAATQE